ncbi:MAG TPA: hypothetical protein VFE91_01615 [Nitrososphaerales archaeon]|nr:hypothetical protein [Nitrososphaerales archaeon]
MSKWFWKRAVRHEMLSAAKTMSLVAGLLLIAAGVLGAASLFLGIILGVGVIILGGRLKHRVWAAGFLLVGLVALYEMGGGIIGEGGAVLVIIAACLGLASTLV